MGAGISVSFPSSLGNALGSLFVKAIRRFTVRTVLSEPLAPLRELMLNLRWSWHPETAELFASIDPAAWAASGGDPIAMVSSLRPEKLATLAADQGFLDRLQAAARDLDAYLTGPRWFQQVQENPSAEPEAGSSTLVAKPSAIAYFSPEYGITEVLPQYSGGLGILAGDHLKAASDLGVPLIGVGLLYRHGYFTQSLSADGWQGERYPASDPNGLPLELLRDRDGTPVKITVALAEGQTLAASTAAAPSTGCARNCCWAWAACARSGPSARSPGTPPPRCSTPTRATPVSWA